MSTCRSASKAGAVRVEDCGRPPKWLLSGFHEKNFPRWKRREEASHGFIEGTGGMNVGDGFGS